MIEYLAQAARVVKYPDCISADGQHSPNKCPGYDIKQSDGEAPVMLEIWGMRNTSSLPSLPDPLCPGEVTPDRVLSMGQIELNCHYAKLNCFKLAVLTFNCVFKLRTYAKLNCLK